MEMRRCFRPHLVVYQQLRSFEVPGRHSHVVLLVWVVELRQTPVDETELKTTSLFNFNVRGEPDKTLRESKSACDTLTFLCSWSIITLCGLTSLCIIPILWQ